MTQAAPDGPVSDEAAGTLPPGTGVVDANQSGPGGDTILLLEQALGCRVLAYFGSSAEIERDNDAQPIRYLLSLLGKQEQLALILQSSGGDPDAAQYLIRLIHQYTDRLDVYVHTHATSAATLMCMGADRLFMSQGAELGPVDPQVPVDADLLMPLARVEQDRPRVTYVPAAVVREFLEFAGVITEVSGTRRHDVDVKRLQRVTGRRLNPWIIGWYEHLQNGLRVYAHRNLTEHLLAGQDSIEQTTQRIIDFFLEHYPSHHASILRDEARVVGGMPVQDTAPEIEELLETLHGVYRTQVQLQPIARIVEIAEAYEAYGNVLTRYCDNCDTEFVDDGRFCYACGTPDWAICEGCAGSIPATWQYCSDCGHPNTPPPSTTRPSD